MPQHVTHHVFEKKTNKILDKLSIFFIVWEFKYEQLFLQFGSEEVRVLLTLFRERKFNQDHLMSGNK